MSTTTKMKTLEVTQRTPEWRELRKKYLTASEAPIIMGASPHVSRDALIKLKYSGDEQDINEYVARVIFKQGLDSETHTHPLAVEYFGEDLFPATGVRTVDKLDLLASFDGITMFEDNTWEHKQYNKKTFTLLEMGGEMSGDIEAKHYWQLEHQMLVADTTSCVFSMADETGNAPLFIVYESQPKRRARLIADWKQFLIDVAAYAAKNTAPANDDTDHAEAVTDHAEAVTDHAEAVTDHAEAVTDHAEAVTDHAEIAAAVATPDTINFDQLPALSVEVTGKVLSSNFDSYQAAGLALINMANTDPKTEDDFGMAEKFIAFFNDMEKDLEKTKAAIIKKCIDIDSMVTAISAIQTKARDTRLTLTGAVKTEKDRIKAVAISAGQETWIEYVGETNAGLAPIGLHMPRIPVDFAAVIKGKRNLDKINGAINNELARAKIEATLACDALRANYAAILPLITGYETLFADDLQTLCENDNREGATAIIKQRISDDAARAPAPSASVHLVAAGNQTASPFATTAPPSDKELLTVLAEHYHVDLHTVISWVLNMDLRIAHTNTAHGK